MMMNELPTKLPHSRCPALENWHLGGVAIMASDARLTAHKG